jgi:hypothetical protein
VCTSSQDPASLPRSRSVEVAACRLPSFTGSSRHWSRPRRVDTRDVCADADGRRAGIGRKRRRPLRPQTPLLPLCSRSFRPRPAFTAPNPQPRPPTPPRYWYTS